MPDKRDSNEAELIRLWRALSCVVIPMDRNAGFDLIVISPRNGIHLVEVKDGSKKWRLTDRERARCAEVEGASAVYSIIENEKQALELVGMG